MLLVYLPKKDQYFLDIIGSLDFINFIMGLELFTGINLQFS